MSLPSTILARLGVREWRRPGWLRYLAALGPGAIAALAGNDAPGITTYSVVGARYGYSLLWVFVFITTSMILIQEMCSRMGAVTGKGLSDLIREQFGVRWTAFAMFTILIANAGTIVSEFAGIAAATDLFYIPRWLVIPPAAALVLLLVTRGSYHRVERIFLALTAVFLTYIASAFLARPDWNAVARSVVVPTWHWDSGFIYMFVALVGTTIAPWMQFLLQSTVVDKGVTIADYALQRVDTIVGVLLASTVTISIIIATGATLHVQGISIETAEDAARALAPIAGQYTELLFAIGLLGASLIGACVLPITTAFSITEAFGWENGLGHSFREAPVFYGLITFLVVLGALIVLIPGVPLVGLLLFTSAVNGVLLPIELVFILRLANDRELMGAHSNGRLFNLLAVSSAIIIGLLSIGLLAVTLVEAIVF